MNAIPSLDTGNWTSYGYFRFPVVADPKLASAYGVKNVGFARIDVPLPTEVVCQSCWHRNQVEPGHVFFVNFSHSLWWNRAIRSKMFHTNVSHVDTPFAVCQDCSEILILIQEDGNLLGYPRHDARWHLKMDNLLRVRIEEKYGSDPHKWTKQDLLELNPYK